LTGAPWRMPEDGTPGTLTAIRSALFSPMTRSWTTYRGSPFSSARGRLVSKSTTGSAGIAHRNAIAEMSTGSFMLASSRLRTLSSAARGCLGALSLLDSALDSPSLFLVSSAWYAARVQGRHGEIRRHRGHQTDPAKGVAHPGPLAGVRELPPRVPAGRGAALTRAS